MFLPVNDFAQLILNTTEADQVTIQITDIFGQVVSAEMKPAVKEKNSFTLSTKNLDEGIYILTLTGKSGSLGSVKIVR